MCYIDVEQGKADRDSPEKGSKYDDSNDKFNSERCYGLDKEHSFLFVCSDKLSRLKRQG